MLNLKSQLIKLGHEKPSLRKHLVPILDTIVTASKLTERQENIISAIEISLNEALKPIRKSAGTRATWEERRFVGNDCVIRGSIRMGDPDYDHLVDQVWELAERKLREYHKFISDMDIYVGDKDYVEFYVTVDLSKIPKERMTKAKALDLLDDLEREFQSRGALAKNPVLLRGKILCYKDASFSNKGDRPSFFVVESGGIWFVRSTFVLTEAQYETLPVSHKDLTYEKYISPGHSVVEPKRFVGWYVSADPETVKLLQQLDTFLKLPIK